MSNSPEVDQLLDPNYSEYAPVANWKNSNQRWAQEHANKIYPKPSEGPSTLIAAACLCGVALACFVAFMNWAIPLVRK